MDRLWLCSGCTARSKDNLQSSWLPRQFCSHACEENYESPFFSQECSLPPEMGSGTSASFRPSSSSSAQIHCERRLVRSLPVNVDSDSCATSLIPESLPLGCLQRIRECDATSTRPFQKRWLL